MNIKEATTDQNDTTIQIFRDPVGLIATVVFGLLAIIVAIIFFYLEREIKALQLIILSRTPLVKVEQSFTRDIKILYLDQPIADLELINIQMENNGNQAIWPADYIEPIKFVFSPKAHLIEASVVETNPINIGARIQVDQNIAVLSNVLFNPSDQIVIRFLVADMPASNNELPFLIDTRIGGIKNIPILDSINEKSDDKIVYIILILLLTMISIIFFSMWLYTRSRLINSLFSLNEIEYLRRTCEALKNSLRDVVTKLNEMNEEKVPSDNRKALFDN